MKKLLPGVAVGVVVAVLAPVVVWQLSSDDGLRREGALAADEPRLVSPNGDYSLVVGDTGVVVKGPAASVTVNEEGALVESGSQSVKVTPTKVVGATGPQGPQGPAGADGANGVSGWAKVTQQQTVTAGGSRSIVAQCPAGAKALGGGFNTFAVGLDVGASRPSSGDTGWEIVVRNPSSGDRAATATALCATVN